MEIKENILVHLQYEIDRGQAILNHDHNHMNPWISYKPLTDFVLVSMKY